jgi:branched-chain amino acid transport system permease protein
MGFMAIGAYAAGILTIPSETKDVLLQQLPQALADAHTNSVVATIVAGLVAAAVAAITSIPLMRLNGITAAISTFALLVIVNVVASNWTQVTNGTAGMAGVPETTTMQTVLVWALISVVVAYLFQESRFGFRLRATREDEVAARAAGVGIYNERRMAWTLSAFFAGVGGALFGQYLGAFSPDVFYLSPTFLVLAMLIVGGLTSLAGAVVGTIVISVVAELLRRLEGGVDVGLFDVPSRPGLADVGLGAIMLAILILRPAGLTGGREFRLPRRRRMPDARPDDVAPAGSSSV